ncbi:hypothetical protein TNCT_215421 [Trichonephila clavata]|uniref:BPTI/Kunitz inhibitor domain-containing protein n=1 Tax=Trichonephila clavata TaxID=2740835 RepID=A0A8X6HS65_TRICU|nr:hypothetical protein TNCT_215421 [Trichonephila clavata]
MELKIVVIIMLFGCTAIVKAVKHAYCLIMPTQGPCKQYEMKYGYEAKFQKCRLFLYGGCQANPNTFSTLRECQEMCED